MNNDNAIIHLRTKHGVMCVNDKGQLFTTQCPTPTDSWRLLGAVEYGRGFCAGRIVKHYTLPDIIANRVPWFFKSGKQRVYALDWDHGSRRVQVSPPLIAVWLKGLGYVSGSYEG